MIKFYFTFGGFNAPGLKNKCVLVEAKDLTEARAKMFYDFGTYWGFYYENKPKEELIDYQTAVYMSNTFLSKN
jgi:hypothetical protein